MRKSAEYDDNKVALIQDFLNMKDESVSYIYDHLYPRIRNHVLRNNGTQEDAIDLIQEVLLTVYESLTKQKIVNIELDFISYLFGIARSLYNAQREYKSKLKKSIPPISNNFDNEIELTGFDEELQEILIRCLDLMPALYKKVLILYYNGSSYREIANELDLKSENSIKNIKTKAERELLNLVRSNPSYKELIK